MFDILNTDTINNNVNEVLTIIKQIQGSIEKMTVDLTKITADVAAVQGVEASAVTLIQALAAAVKAIPPSTDPTTQAALDSLSSQLETGTASLSAAVVANPAPVANT